MWSSHDWHPWDFSLCLQLQPLYTWDFTREHGLLSSHIITFHPSKTLLRFPCSMQQVPSRWVLEMKDDSRSSCLLCSLRRAQPCWEKLTRNHWAWRHGTLTATCQEGLEQGSKPTDILALHLAEQTHICLYLGQLRTLQGWTAAPDWSEAATNNWPEHDTLTWDWLRSDVD